MNEPTQVKAALVVLPPELLDRVVELLHDIRDLAHLAATCRALRGACASATPRTLFRLAYVSSASSPLPHPYLLVLACARRLSAWARADPANAEVFDRAVQGGIGEVAYCCYSTIGLELAELREVHAARGPVIDVLAASIAEVTNEEVIRASEAHRVPGRSAARGAPPHPAATLDSVKIAVQILIYYRLFAMDVEAVLDPAASLPQLNSETRLNYIKYCMPDWSYMGVPEGQELLLTLRYFLSGDAWRTWITTLKDSAGPGFDDKFRGTLWDAAVLAQALSVQDMRGLQACSVGQELRTQLLRTRARIERMEAGVMPCVSENGTPMCEIPDLLLEIDLCTSGSWWYD